MVTVARWAQRRQRGSLPRRCQSVASRRWTSSAFQTDAGAVVKRPRRDRRRPRGPAAGSKSPRTPPTRRCTSTASSPGSTSTTACCSSPRTTRVPLLERVKFCAIYTTNLDEYYMVRVAGLHDQIDAGVEQPHPGRADPLPDDRPDPRAGAGAGPAPGGLLRRAAAPAAGRATGSGSWPWTSSTRHQREQLARALPARDLPGPDPAGGGPGAAVPVHLEPVAEPRGAGPRPVRRSAQTVFARVKVPTEILPRFVSVGAPEAGPRRCWSRSRT